MASRPVPDPVAPGQESVWDYPRPPALRTVDHLVTVVLGGVEICETQTSVQYLETSHPPTYYLPRSAFVAGSLKEAGGSSYCEWKGEASYLDVRRRRQVARRAAWTYLSPTPRYAALRGMIALYPGRWTPARSTASGSSPSPGRSTAAGSPAPSAVRSRAGRAPGLVRPVRSGSAGWTTPTPSRSCASSRPCRPGR